MFEKERNCPSCKAKDSVDITSSGFKNCMCSLNTGYEIHKEKLGKKEIKKEISDRFGKYVKNNCAFWCVHPQFYNMKKGGINENIMASKRKARTAIKNNNYGAASRWLSIYTVSRIETMTLEQLAKKKCLTFINPSGAALMPGSESRKYLRGVMGYKDNFIGYFSGTWDANNDYGIGELAKILGIKKLYLFGELYKKECDGCLGSVYKLLKNKVEELKIIAPASMLDKKMFLGELKNILSAEEYGGYFGMDGTSVATDNEIKNILGISLNKKWEELRKEL